jgi:L-aspartate oxidase
MATKDKSALDGVERRSQGGVVIVGAGLAGLFTALKLAPLPVTVISVTPFGQGGSSVWAQAGIAAALSEGDSPELHAADTIRAGAGIVDENIALLLAREARGRIEDLLRYGVPFDKDLEGHLDFAREAAHGARRILHVKGDTAGRAIMAALTVAARATPSIQVLEGWSARDLVIRDGQVAGIEIARVDANPFAPSLVLDAAAVVLATGGSGQLFAITTNPRESRGEGIAIAARAGATVADAEFVQFHPTAINVGRDPAPLATESLRGEGALLINGRGERFMRALHPDAELGPRDIVARGVYREVMSGRGAFLDCRKIGPEFPARFPTRGASRSRLRRPPTITWAASTPTRTDAPRSKDSGPAARLLRPGRMAPTDWRRIPSSRRWCSAPAWLAISPSGCRRAKLLRSISPQRRPTLSLRSRIRKRCKRCAEP